MNKEKQDDRTPREVLADLDRIITLARQKRRSIILDVYKGGATFEEVSEATGISYYNVRRLVRDAGLTRRRAPRNGPRPGTVKLMNRVAELRGDGERTHQEIADITGASRPYVAELLRRHKAQNGGVPA